MDLKAFPVPSHWEMRKCRWMRQEIDISKYSGTINIF